MTRRRALEAVRIPGLLLAVGLLSAPAGANPIKIGGVDAQSQYTGFETCVDNPPTVVCDTPGVFTFNDTRNGDNPSPEPGTVTTEQGVSGFVGGRIDLEMILDTSGFDPATGNLTDARFIGTGSGPEVVIFDPTLTTVLLTLDLDRYEINSALPFSPQTITGGDNLDSGVQALSDLTVTGGTLAGDVGGIGTPAVLKMVWTNPSNPLPPPPTNFPNYPGYLNESFTIGFQSNPASAVNWDIAFIPEPGTAALLGFGLVGLWAHARRRSAR